MAIIKESDLSGHLSNGLEEDQELENNDNTDEEDDQQDGPSLVESDYQLYEALNVLKGLAIHLKKVG